MAMVTKPSPSPPAATPSARRTVRHPTRLVRNPKPRLEAQGLGWINKLGTGKGEYATTSGIEGAWTQPDRKGQWLLRHPVRLRMGTRRAQRRPPVVAEGTSSRKTCVPDAHTSPKKHPPMMTTADLALRFDPIYEPIARRFHGTRPPSPMPSPAPGSSSPIATWGPRRATSALGPGQDLIWRDPVPALDHR